ncbi:hypothetical protein BU24DRAFT_420070 [Aaosphaeria arxii CBS 175.79]|uniref:Zn(2)-C6 fungal-type domain-containing protein n=1 Tax=Aaosphaeria arxii CBS 175.79 TaxID=1450172 RepID=A0A6A5XVS5_9PLEO|nr:uncharacterized protein BU24DRAFT_420070 [Aaosphaeria arxii CBS 175.79]KAF2017046.1 hypothetical protein BU24DRAFT_420070 [Aaosphaeria arxii CBS 175.79]
MFSSNPATTASTPPAPAPAPKLRDSCEACAASKLKCHKQKPTCSRCAKRGITCQYLATRRAGRRYDNNRRPSERRRPESFSLPAEPQLDPLDLNSWFAAEAAASSGDDFPPMPKTASSVSTTASNPSSGLDSTMLTPVDLNDMMTDIDDYFLSPTSLWMPDSTGTDMLAPLDADFFNMPSGGMDPTFNDNIKTSHSVSSPDSGITDLKKPMPELNLDISSFTQGFSSSFGCCMMQAMCLLQQLFPQSMSTTETSCENTKMKSAGNSPSPPPEKMAPPMEAVIATNKQAIDAVGTMLECSCVQSGYLLAILSLIVFKALDSYDAAANSTQPRLENPLDEDSRYTAAQLVLGELHRVQRLVNQLSGKMKEHIRAAGIVPNKDLIKAEAGVDQPMGDASMPFSENMLEQLEADMRRRLKKLSLSMASYLRRD